MISFPLIRIACEDLQVPRHMQTANNRVTQWHDVIDLMPDSGMSRESHRLSIECAEGFTINPFRSGAILRCLSLRDTCVDFVAILLYPFSIVVPFPFGVFKAPAMTVFTSSLAMAFGPLFKSVRIRLVPYLPACINALLAAVRQSVIRVSSIVKLNMKLDLFAVPATLKTLHSQCIARCTLIPQGRLALMRTADSTETRYASAASAWPSTVRSSRSEHLKGLGLTTTRTYLFCHWRTRGAFSGSLRGTLCSRFCVQSVFMPFSIPSLNIKATCMAFLSRHQSPLTIGQDSARQVHV